MKKVFLGILIAVLCVVSLGAIGFIAFQNNEGFHNWVTDIIGKDDNDDNDDTGDDDEEEEQDTRQNLVVIDFSPNTTASSLLDSNKIAPFLNTHATEPIIAPNDPDSPYLCERVYKEFNDNTGFLKLGNATSGGWFIVTFDNDFTYTNYKITARAYGSKNGQTGIWTCDANVEMEVNDGGQYTFPNNATNTTLPPELVTHEYDYEGDEVNRLDISTSGGRLLISQIELWTV